MVNYNGSLIKQSELSLSSDNRGFKFGDSVFETMKVKNGRIIFWEDHYFRLMASMRMLRMEIPLSFTLEFLQEEILKTIDDNNLSKMSRIRLSVFRKDGGYYSPLTNEIEYLIESKPLELNPKNSYRIDLYKDFYNYSGMLSNIKTNNKILNTVASVYAKENELDNCILLNERKGVCEAINGNIFLIKDSTIKTPSLTEGCLKGIIRGKIIEMLKKNPNYEVEETVITPFEIQKSDEVFITNSIVGIQSVTDYRKKQFSTEITEKIKQSLSVLEMTS